MAMVTSVGNLDMKKYDDLFKIVIIGDSGVGKSCLLLRFADDTFTDNYYTTIGVDFRFKCLTIDNRRIKLQIWDTAGQEKFKTVTSSYYRGADGIIIVYDQTDQQSFEHLTNWLEDIHKYTTDDPIKLIIGNKDDLSQQKVVSEQSVRELSNRTGIEVLSASAKNSHQVHEAFEKLTQRLITQREKKDVTKGYSLVPTPLEGKFAEKNKCCNSY